MSRSFGIFSVLLSTLVYSLFRESTVWWFFYSKGSWGFRQVLAQLNAWQLSLGVFGQYIVLLHIHTIETIIRSLPLLPFEKVTGFGPLNVSVNVYPARPPHTETHTGTTQTILCGQTQSLFGLIDLKLENYFQGPSLPGATHSTINNGCVSRRNYCLG